MFINRKISCSLMVLLSAQFLASHSFAAGMVPDTSMLYINEAKQGGSINIKNTDANPGLLYTSINDLPDDQGTHLVVTQPVVRVEGGKTQQLRFVLQTDKPLTVEHLKRVVFEGIPQKTPGKNKISFNIRQDLPVLIHPASLPEVKDAWTLLTWSQSGNSITVKNSSAYVVRMVAQFELLPSHAAGALNKTYLLPGQSMTVKADKATGNDKQVKFTPVSRYGIPVPAYTADFK
ncbi:fimbria/pilus chaperone family protein [Buttiauxella izardii]|uniref:Fimbrial chaperone protein n=1 Tax=Buttiauxella izardii TaxID=82991 RepID=A0A3A5K5Q7_9ENTR|nr:fimbria/pilus chaperone family protein [Buttiauxella izardii]RJT27899.1 fimbrial chaperone protein [Buttiauxella izardii]